MKYLLLAFALLASPALAQSTPTLVQQLQSQVAYAEEYLEYHPCTNCYTSYFLARKTKQLNIALAAAAAGTPLPPLLNEAGQVQALTAPYGSGFKEGGGTATGGTTTGSDGTK